ncbi:MAG: response regulator, partial [Cyanobacteria bacterium J06648_11]
LEDTLDLLAPVAAEKGLELTSWIEPDVPDEVVGDPNRLRQVLANLVGNAVKFTEVGEVEITVRRCPGDDIIRELDAIPAAISETEPVELEWIVRDTGIGIPGDRLARLFQPFSQVDASVTRRYGGTGLGLAISQRLCEIMGGAIDVASQVGRGSTFSFTASFPAVLPASGAEPEDGFSLAGQRVLLLYDNAAVRRNLSRQLVRVRAAEVIEVATPRQALTALDINDAFDLAIVDVSADSSEFARTLAHLNTLENLKLLALGNAKQAARMRAIEIAGASAFAFKPIKPSQFVELLRRLERPQPRRADARPDRLSVAPASSLASSMRLLVVDDVPLNQKVALQMLDRLGYRADVASDGREALDLLHQHHYDTVLMDVQMPEMDGLQVTRQLRARSGVAECPWIIAMTAHALAGDRERCLEAGMNDYVAKPVRAEALARALSRAAKTLGLNSQPLPSS